MTTPASSCPRIDGVRSRPTRSVRVEGHSISVRDESRRMNLNDDIVYRCLRLGPLHQRHPGPSRSLVRHHDRLHPAPPCIQSFGRRSAPPIAPSPATRGRPSISLRLRHLDGSPCHPPERRRSSVPERRVTGHDALVVSRSAVRPGAPPGSGGAPGPPSVFGFARRWR